MGKYAELYQNKFQFMLYKAEIDTKYHGGQFLIIIRIKLFLKMFYFNALEECGVRL